MGIVFYTNSNLLIPTHSAGCARGIFIFIRPEYKEDAGLHAHERKHVQQYLRTFGLHPLLYRFSKKYRFESEVDAYARQLRVNRNLTLIKQYARYIATHYGLNVTVDEAAQALHDRTR